MHKKYPMYPMLSVFNSILGKIANKFKTLEELGHNLAYYDYQANTTIKLLNENGRQETFLSKPIASSHPGLIASVLMPKYNDQSKELDIKLLFRGTHNSSSMLRNLQPLGPGHDSLVKEHASITQQLKDLIEDHAYSNQPIKLTIAGHSLGGSDAQNYQCLLMMEIFTAIQSDINCPLRSIKHINLGIQNSAGVPDKVADLSLFLAPELAKHGIKLEANIIMVEGDEIQYAGSSTVFNDLDAKDCEVNLLKVTLANNPDASSNLPDFLKKLYSMGVSIKNAHTAFHFTQENQASSNMQLLSNDCPANRKIVKEELTQKKYSTPNTHPALTSSQQGLYSFFERSRKIAAKANGLLASQKSSRLLGLNRT